MTADDRSSPVTSSSSIGDLAWHQFPAPVIFSVQGKDAPRYLHARLTNDVKGLAIGSARLAAALNPQGRTEGLFRVYRGAEQEFLLICDGGNASEILTAVKRYIVADRVEVTDLSGAWSLVHILSVEAFDPLADCSAYSGRRLERRGIDLVGPTARLVETTAGLGAAIDLESWEGLRISGGVPSFPGEVSPDRLFWESGLRGAASFTKGCYVGQEVVEKIDSHGKAPRQLCRIRLHGLHAITPGAAVCAVGDGEKKLGEVLSAAALDQENTTVGFVSARSPEGADGVPVVVEGVAGMLSAPLIFESSEL